MIEIEKPRIETEELTEDGKHGRFVVEPLERGFGNTLGNSLRRVLLSSLEGCAVTSIKIDGVLHEFSTIPGVKEDVTEIVLNMKSVVAKLYETSPKVVEISAQGPCVVTAGDIKCDSEVELLHPEQHIATLGEDAKLNMEITIDNGQAVTTSLAVANFFSKRHDDVLKKIRTLDCSPEFCARNFAETSISGNQANGGTRKLPCYQITRDGFAFLAMGFTGKRAARFKEAYINAFNLMEKSLSGADASDMSAVARNARGVYLHLREIHQIWTSQLYPMLKAVESPLASKLYDRVGDAVFGAALVDSRLNGSDKEVRP